MESSSYRLGYRADVEGLRALAILLVISAHSNLPWLEGGFIGVDVFFVLSGYLITGILLQEIRATGRIDLLTFFARRLRRLLPALLFMVVSVAITASLLMPPIDQTEHAYAAGAAILWVSNILFAFTNMDYFSHGEDQSLYLHTWSLGVEEQFYIVWPLLMLAFLGAFAFQGGQRNFKRLRVGMHSVIRICFVVSLFLSFAQPMWGFYLMPSRAWQFATGALVMLWTTEDGKTLVDGRRSSSVLKVNHYAVYGGWIGLFLIVGTALFLERKITYPGFWAVIPTIGSALVLYSGSFRKSSAVGRVLSFKPLQWLGRVSYSWYLWHWPVFVLGGVLAVNKGVVDWGALIGLSLMIASLSYYVVESPIRRNTLLLRRPAIAVSIAIALMGGGSVASAGWREAIAHWEQSPEMRRYVKVRIDYPEIYDLGCDDWFHSAEVRLCVFGDKKAENTALLLGDSVVGQWFPAVRSAFNRPGWKVLVLTKSSCPMVDESWFYERIGGQYTICEEWRKTVLATIGTIKPNIVITGGSSNYDFTETQWVSGTKRVLAQLAPVSDKVFILRGTHGLGFDGPSCLARQHWKPSFLTRATDCSSPAGSTRENHIYTWLQRAAADYENVFTIDLNSIVCPGNRCYAERAGTIIYRDSQHLAADFVTGFGDTLAQHVFGGAD